MSAIGEVVSSIGAPQPDRWSVSAGGHELHRSNATHRISSVVTAVYAWSPWDKKALGTVLFAKSWCIKIACLTRRAGSRLTAALNVELACEMLLKPATRPFQHRMVQHALHADGPSLKVRPCFAARVHDITAELFGMPTAMLVNVLDAASAPIGRCCVG